MACDIRIAVPHARLALPELKYGLIPGWGGGIYGKVDGKNIANRLAE